MVLPSIKTALAGEEAGLRKTACAALVPSPPPLKMDRPAAEKGARQEKKTFWLKPFWLKFCSSSSLGLPPLNCRMDLLFRVGWALAR